MTSFESLIQRLLRSKIEMSLWGDQQICELAASGEVDATSEELFSAFGKDWKVFWQGKGDKRCYVGLGSLFRFESSDIMTRDMDQIPESLRVYGGLPFGAISGSQNPSSHESVCWQSFGAGGFFFVPVWEWCFEERSSDQLSQRCQVKLRLTLATGTYESGILRSKFRSLAESFLVQYRVLDEAKQKLNFGPNNPVYMTFNQAQDLPDYDSWSQNVAAIHTLIQKKSIQKIVLSRSKIIHCSDSIPQAWLLTNLRLELDASYLFAVAAPSGDLFLGRSPERVLSWQGQRVFADAIAGTRKRQSDQIFDQSTARDLIGSPKDLREHRTVSDYVELVLKEFCEDVRICEREALLRLRYVQHMISSYSGQLCNKNNALELLMSLHPTPAVAGMPRALAIDFINQSEGFSRGWFAGSIGWTNGRTGDFALAIRSALIRNNEMRVFAGAGIVDGSDAQAEWDETEFKMLNFTNLLRPATLRTSQNPTSQISSSMLSTNASSFT